MRLNISATSVRKNIDGACLFCATAVGAKDGVQKCGLKLIDEYEQHVSIANLVSDGYQIINF